ncbi:hypothetical protein M3I54_39380 [Paraburkholderia sp. CNPSo 3274]|uniref:hypothetical protein n=1 Tax=Paraburkholderia sp. CNPSo 3274 TaxID=2940932 RepID=UPI0020B74D27|nr:hypothetical protein [Paraburkholderia sp. CNPSo 3274]MCP3712891.1 hypothetical protein [Paraburkholderia sp. CNPSo 3274]
MLELVNTRSASADCEAEITHLRATIHKIDAAFRLHALRNFSQAKSPFYFSMPFNQVSEAPDL